MSGEKEVVENVSGWLKVFSDGSVERLWTGDEQVRALIRPVPPSNESFVDGVATRDVVVDAENGVWVRIYLPHTAKTADRKLGVLIHFRGGGFCISHADWQMYYGFYSRLVRASGMVCVSVEYRHAPEHRLPAAFDDCFGVVSWLGTVARGETDDAWLGRYADFSRCVLIGDSAGGNIVHEVALRARVAREELRPLCMRGGVLLHPGFMRAERSKSEAEIPPESGLLTTKMVDKFMELSLPLGSTKDHPITNPMGPLAPPLQKLSFPCMMVAVADRDLIRDTQLEYCRAMKSAGHEVNVFVSENVGHSFYINEIAIQLDPHVAMETTKLMEAIDGFIDSCFNDKVKGK